MNYVLTITPEELLKKEFYVDYDEKTLKFEKGKGIFDSTVYFLNYNEQFEFLYEEMTYGWRLEFKTIWLGTNSDNFYVGGVAINILGQMLEQHIIKFESKVKEL